MDNVYIIFNLISCFADRAFMATVLLAYQEPCCPELNLSGSSYSWAVALLRLHTAWEEMLPERLNSGQNCSV